MIKINKAYVSATNTVNLKVETIPGETISRVLIYALEDYEDPSKAVDVSYLLKRETNIEDINIPAEDFKQQKIEGFFIIKIKSSEENIENNCDIIYNEAIAVISNHIKYETCILERVLKIKTEGCSEESLIDNCEECTNGDVDNACYASTLFNSLKAAVQHGFYSEAKQIKKELDCICKPCKGCPDYLDSEFFNGSGFGTFDNNVILI